MTPRLIPGLPDDMALYALAKLPRSLHGKLRAVCCSWRDALHTQGAVVALRKRLGITDCWLAIVFVRFGLLHFVFFDPINGASMTSVAQLHLGDAGSCPGCSVCRDYKTPVAVGHKIFFPAFESVAFKTLRCFDAEIMQWGKDLQLTTLGVPKHGALFYAACAEANKRAFYVAGGKLLNGRGFKGAGRVDIETRIWEALPKLHNKRWGASAVLLHGRFCVLGGGGVGGEWLMSGEEWDPINRRWILTPELYPARPYDHMWQYGPDMAVLKDKLYAVQSISNPRVHELFYYAEDTKLWISMDSFCISALLSEASSGWYEEETSSLKMVATAEELLLVCQGEHSDDEEERNCFFVLSTNPTNLSKPITWKAWVLPLPEFGTCNIDTALPLWNLIHFCFRALTVHVT